MKNNSQLSLSTCHWTKNYTIVLDKNIVGNITTALTIVLNYLITSFDKPNSQLLNFFKEIDTLD